MNPTYLREVVKARHNIYLTTRDAYALGIAAEASVVSAWLAYEAAVAHLESVEMKSYLEERNAN